MKRLLRNQTETIERCCDWPGCRNSGEFRAPKSRTTLNEYYWFCLDHVRQYNTQWNYYEGMSDEEVEADLRKDTTWGRPTWKLGTGANFAAANRAFSDPLNLMGETSDAGPPPNAITIDPETARALNVFALELPIDRDDVRSRYKELVKRHHPDANGGRKAAEEEFKRVQAAYQTLLAFCT